MMDIFEKLHDRYTQLSVAGYELGDEYKDLIAKYQTRWNAGERFDLSNVNVMNLMVTPEAEAWQRDPADEESELAACLAELAGKVKTALLENWAKRYSRDQMQTVICSLAALDWNGAVVVHGMVAYYYELADAWNNAHADAEAIEI